MKISINHTRSISGQQAAEKGAELIREAINMNGAARIILATGASQFEMLQALVAQPDIDWSKCSVFHLDEYIGLASDHPASFINYLTTRFIDHVPALTSFEAINGIATNINDEIDRLNTAIGRDPIDVAFIGIGENGHLAFNDPPADFDIKDAYLRVSLDQMCREQQQSEGWFDTLADVPLEAITMSVHQILKSISIICTVPDARKAMAVQGTVEGPVSDLCPASALQSHKAAWLFLDEAASSGLTEKADNA